MCPTSHWLDPYARARPNFSSKTHRIFNMRELLNSGQRGEPSPLRMDVSRGHSSTASPWHKDKALLLDITIIANTYVRLNLDNSIWQAEKHLADAKYRKKKRYRGLFLATYSSLPLVRRLVVLAQRFTSYYEVGHQMYVWKTFQKCTPASPGLQRRGHKWRVVSCTGFFHVPAGSVIPLATSHLETAGGA